MAKKAAVAADFKESEEIMIVYTQDIPYIGRIAPSDLENAKSGVAIRNPFVLNVRPITNEKEGKLETVVLDIMLPVEFAGLPLNENMYTGMVVFTQTPMPLPSGKSSSIQIEGETFGINRLSSMADRQEPIIWAFDVQKVLMPSDDLKVIYAAKEARYKELLFASRMVELQALAEAAAADPEPDMPMEQVQEPKLPAPVIDMVEKGKKTIH